MNQNFNSIAIDSTFNSQKSKSISLRNSTTAERVRQLEKLQDWIKSHLEDIRKAIYADFKKPYPEIDASEIFVVTSEIKHAIKNLASWMSPKKVSTPTPMLGSKAHIQYEPKGTTLIIAPWNYPFNLAIGPLVSALAAGCTAIVKPSELTPHTSALIRRMIEEIYEPELVAVVEGEVEVAQYLLSKPFDHIFFTGSPAVGKIIMKAAAENLASVTLELGGKSPAIVDSDVDIQDAASKIVWGKYVNCGQTCIAPDYILVQENIKNELIEAIHSKINEMYDPKIKGIDESKDYARIVNDKHLKRLKHLLDDANRKGAKIAVGGKIIETENYFEPTVMIDLTEEMDVMQEEIFGPILPIITYSSIEEAINYINEKSKPLALYIFSNSKNVSETILTQTSSGGAVVNDCVVHFLQNELPFGGVNNSGIGKAHGHFGFLSFSNEKAILEQRVGLTPSKSLYPPYNFITKKISQALLKWF
ncbi:NAD-dependent aldehyde dehydrogenase [Belliella baltica DSM 15883]|uniref:Aldehyde dehydrogenase n=1 Tax=Belliella baltica (strain DSM 15883 / CIP 108006 / LMG 21964 / BA134) TaxID=866536 RepID=I3Z440_BELBD|nr:aldehyde dehydrogenase family protein [Belliella baltica]AFL84008.1 NAD-dependent aldehyde dehydrogenase [Belliella baltica DSM 15883]